MAVMLLPDLFGAHYGGIVRKKCYLETLFDNARRDYKVSIRRW